MEPDDLVFLRIKQDEIRAEYKIDNKKHTKYLSLNDLASMLSKDIKLDTGTLSLGGSNYIGVRKYVKKGSVEIILLECSPGMRDLKYRMYDREGDNRERRTVNTFVPTCLMAVVVENNRFKDSLLFSAKLPVVSNTVPLYKFPMGNMHADSRICWGENNLRDIGADKFKLLTTFLESEFNDDLGFYHGGQRGNNRSDWLDYIDGKTALENSHYLQATLPDSSSGNVTIERLLTHLEERHISRGNRN
jgi:hypothetical protein